MRNIFLCFIVILITSKITAQNISNIKVSPNQEFMAYLKDGDSLFIKNLKDGSYPKLVFSGFNNEINPRFFMWTPNGEQFVFESKNSIYTHRLETDNMEEHILPDNIQLFKYFRINQAGMDKKERLYFTAFYPGENSVNQLFQLDLSTGKLTVIATETWDIGNVTVSPKGNLIAYSYYHSSYDQSEASIKIINPDTKKVLFKKEYPNKSFFSNISFADNNTLLARNVHGHNHIIHLNPIGKKLTTTSYSVDSIGSLIRFVTETEVLSLKSKGDERIYSLLNSKNGKQIEILRGKNYRLVDLVKKGNKYHLMYTDENGNTPKKFIQRIISGSGNRSKDLLLYSFVKANPLKKMNYEIFNYTNGDGTQSKAFLYLPSVWNKSHKSIPVILMVYGGYSDTFPEMSYFMNTIFFKYVEQGIALAFVNTRGYANNRVGDKYGKFQLEDTDLFVEELVKAHPISKDRIFLAGHSHGATMVFYYLTHSDRYAGGIAINGAADWIEQAKLKRMTGLPGEMGGAPDSLASKYIAYSPLENISKNMAPILMVAGHKDGQIPWEINSGAFHQKANEMGIKNELIQFEDEGHLIEKIKNINLLEHYISVFLKDLLSN